MAIKVEVFIAEDGKEMTAAVRLGFADIGYTQQELDIAKHIESTVNTMFQTEYQSKTKLIHLTESNGNVH